ncbi:hypothetical protein [Streptomyces sp. NPDC086782]|uniref:hypothetical protein n=1 Tax=Streptomyces sp. NPDC086782 TaxID=3365757 RepID=UPI00382D55A2
MRAEVALHRDLPARHLVTLAADPEPAVRRAACRRAWPCLEPDTHTSLMAERTWSTGSAVTPTAVCAGGPVAIRASRRPR